MQNKTQEEVTFKIKQEVTQRNPQPTHFNWRGWENDSSFNVDQITNKCSFCSSCCSIKREQKLSEVKDHGSPTPPVLWIIIHAVTQSDVFADKSY